ncbi:MAG: hypothetical protein WC823_06635 [Parcubacteria group bacterium]
MVKFNKEGDVMAGAGETGEKQVIRALSGCKSKALGERRYRHLGHTGPIVVATGSQSGRDEKDGREKSIPDDESVTLIGL